MSPDEFRDVVGAVQEKLLSRGFDVRPLILESPASPGDLEALEARLDLPLPPTFKRMLCEYSRHVEFRWFAPDGVVFPEPFQSNFCGDLHWSIGFTEQFNNNKNDWINKVFPNADDPYDAVWHKKLAFYEVGNGDYLAVDLSPERYEEIVYLSHDDGEGHGYVMASNIIDLLRRWVPLACTGGDDWQWLPFTDSKQGPINPESAEAARWRRNLGLSE